MAIWRLPMTLAESGKKRSSLYEAIKSGTWTRPVKLGPRAVGWPDTEVRAINAARIAGDSELEIRALVVRLEADRKKAPGAGNG